MIEIIAIVTFIILVIVAIYFYCEFIMSLDRKMKEGSGCTYEGLGCPYITEEGYSFMKCKDCKYYKKESK